MKAMVKAAFVGALAACMLIAACSPFGGASVFNCENDSQCAGGVCQPERVCSFADTTCPSGQRFGEHAGSLSNTCVGDQMMGDAAIDAPTMCTAGTKSCFNHAVETCNATGTGFDPQMRQPCALTCIDGGGTPSCVAATNIAATDQQMCNATGQAPALAPPTGATVTFTEMNITCTPTCGAVGTITRTASAPNSFYCLSSINIPAGVTFQVGGATSAITLFSNGAVTISSDISFDGGDATASVDANTTNDDPGAGGPGGFAGGALGNQNVNGNAGMGPCAGAPGQGQGADGARDGGGGGGAANNGNGGDGGNGQNANTTAAGGAGANGGTTCSAVDGKPLVGGSGGAGGADGACGPNDPCGWPGGGGGGALHIVSRTMITGAGVLSASGGDGVGNATGTGGGGGGGAGGFILLEAPTINYTGTLRVNGGDGGRGSVLPNGGAGANGANANGADALDSNVNDTSGPGGGGGGGRVRINATTGASCATATPTGANTCTTGALRATP